MGQRRADVRLAAALRAQLLWVLPLLAAEMFGPHGHCTAQAREPELVARKAYSAGVAAFQNGDNEQALTQFTLADQTVSSPNVKLMLARTLARLSRRIEAHQVLHQALQTAGDQPRYETTARTVRDELRELERQLALVRLRIAEPSDQATLRVDGRLIERSLWSDAMALEPGTVRIELAEPDGRRDRQQLELSAGSSLTLDMHVPRAPALAAASAPPPAAAAKTARVKAPQPELKPSSGSHQLRPVSYIVAGIGVAGLAAFGILGTLSDKEFSTLENACPKVTNCDERYRDTATRGQTYQTIANVSVGVGAAALAAGVVLWLIGGQEERAPSAAKRTGPRPLALTGSF